MNEQILRAINPKRVWLRTHESDSPDASIHRALKEPGFEAPDLFPSGQVFLLSFLITLIEAVHLCGDLVKPFTYLSSERPNLSLQLLPKNQPHSFHFVLGDCHARVFITPVALGQSSMADKTITIVRICF
ncbi:MAG: hypothetical protein ABR607_13395 [Pyrinomonadaceae bacterium]